MVTYIYSNVAKSEEMARQNIDLNQQLANSVNNYEKKGRECELYKEAYETLLNSTSWKLTRPLRRISDIIKR